VRTATEAVYYLLNVDRGVPEVFGSIYDVRELMISTALLRDGKKLPIPGFAKKYVKRSIIVRML
jgi:oleate hydratase